MNLNSGVKTGDKRRWIPLKYLLVMKLIVLLITIACLQVSARTSAQSITLAEKNASLTDVFNSIKQQSKYHFFWKGDDLSKFKVSVSLKNASIEQVMNEVLKGLPLSYSITEETIVIKQREETFLDKIKTAFAIPITVSGKVTDETGQPLPGVTVRIKGNNLATATDNKGSYTITVSDNSAILVFSFIGYETQELTAKDIANGSVIILKATQTNLREVVVSKGYYRTTQELNTGDVTRVSGEDIQKQPVSDPILALEGRVPGMQITQTSGLPGAYSTIRIRGQNSIANGNDPLYIVDGVPFTSATLTSPFIGGGAVGNPAPYAPNTSNVPGQGLSPFNNLNPSDIESIEVLKDADATTIYGSRGANGVILITTKKGKAGVTKVDFNTYSGIGQVARQIPLLNTQQYLAMRHEAFKNDGLTPGAGDYDLNGTWDTTANTNWQKVLIGGTSHFTNSQVTISGGNTNTQFLVGGGYSRQTTVFPGSYFDQKGSVHLNLNHTSTNQKFHANFSASYSSDNNQLPQSDWTNNIALAPILTPYDKQGNINFQYVNGTSTFNNPLGGLYFQFANAITHNLIGNANLSYEIIPGLVASTNLGYTTISMNQTQQTFAGLYPAPSNTDPNSRSNFLSNSNVGTWIVEPQLNYVKSIGKGKLDILLGSTFQQVSQNSTGYGGVGFSSDALVPNISAASFTAFLGNNSSQYRYNAIFGRINYNLEEKYLVNITARRDGSSRFGPEKQFGNFGALGAGWIFSKEKWVEENLSFLSFGKLRGSYGITGNDQLPDYQYLSSYSVVTQSYQGVTGLTPVRIPNNTYGWELVRKLEGGLDLGFFKDRVQLDVSYYQNRTNNQLVGYALPSISGFTSVQANLPAVIQNTGFEMVLNTINIKGKDFRWNTSFNISVPRNKLVSYPGLASSPYNQTYAIGQSLFIQYRLHNLGINPQTGLYTIQDLNNDGAINTKDYQLIKQVAQDYFGGLGNSFSYRGFQLDIFFQFVKQTGINYLGTFTSPGVFNPSATIQNQPTYVLSRWQNQGDITDVQKFSTLSQPAEHSLGDAIIGDASFIRLKNVAFSYNIPQKWAQDIHFQSARVYLQGQNLLTLTHYKGLDPETQGISLPPLRMITAGIQFSL